MVCRQLGRHSEGEEALESAISLSGGQLHLVGELALSHAVTGRWEEARAVLDEGALSETLPSYAAMVHSAMGETDEAFYWLEDAFQRRDPLLPVLTWYEGMGFVKTDPRFHEFRRRLALP